VVTVDIKFPPCISMVSNIHLGTLSSLQRLLGERLAWGHLNAARIEMSAAAVLTKCFHAAGRDNGAKWRRGIPIHSSSQTMQKKVLYKLCSLFQWQQGTVCLKFLCRTGAPVGWEQRRADSGRLAAVVWLRPRGAQIECVNALLFKSRLFMLCPLTEASPDCVRQQQRWSRRPAN
jgi:hypothetical protein